MRMIVAGMYAAWAVVLAAAVGRHAGKDIGLLRETIPAALEAFGGFSVPGLAVALLRVLVLAGMAAGALFVLAASGGPFVRWFKTGRASSPAGAALGVGFGWLLITAVVSGLGACGLLFKSLFGAGAVGMTALLLHPAGRPFALSLARALRNAPPAAASVLLVSLGLAAGFAALPVVVGDVSAYHLGAPEAFLEAHKRFAHVWDPAWHQGLAVEMAQLPALAVGGILPAKFVNLTLLLTCCAAVLCFGLNFFSRGTAWWGAVLAGTCGLGFDMAFSGKTDLGAAAGVTLAALAAARGLGRGHGGWWLAGGVLAGFAMCAKLNAGFALLGSLAATVLVGGSLRRTAAMGLAALAVMAPFLLANEFLVGNPVYPFAGGVLGGLYMIPDLESSIRLAWRTLSGAGDWSPAAFFASLVSLGLPSLGSVGLGLALPLALFERGRVAPPPANWCRWCFLISCAAILMVNQVSRYLGMLLPLACILAARALFEGRVPGTRGLKQGVVLGVTLASVALVAVRIVNVLPVPWLAYLTGQTGISRLRLADNAPGETARRWINSSLTAKDRLFVGWEQRLLELVPRQLSANVWIPSPLWWWTREAPDPDRLRVKLRQRGVSHILHNIVRARFAQLAWYQGPDWNERQLGVYLSFARRHLEAVYRPERVGFERGNFYVFRVRKRAGREARSLIALPGTEGLFKSMYEALRKRPAVRRGLPLELAREVARRLPGVLDARNWEGTLLAKTGRWAEALPILEKEWRAGYVNHDNLDLLAQALRKAGRKGEAKEVEARARELYGD